MWAEPAVNEDAAEFRDVSKLKRRLQTLDGEFKKFDYSPGNLSALLTRADNVFQEVGAVIVNHFKTHHRGLPPDSLHVYASWINLSGTINRLRALTHSDVAALTVALDNTSVILENLKSAKRTIELSKFLTSEALTGGNENDASIGAATLQRYTREPLVSFDDIVGMDAEKQRIVSVTTLTKYGLNANSYGAMLLYGPPGTGKSTFVEAAARQMNAQYVFVSNSDLFLPTFGAAEALLAEIFTAASAVASRGKIVLLFFDEIDTISGRDANEVRASLTAVFLHHLDPKRLSPNVFVAAATNYMERVDPAIARRLMPAIKLPLPTAEIIVVMLRRMCVFLFDAVGWANAMARSGFSQANVKTVVNGVIQALKMWSVSSGLFVETDGGYDLTTLGTSTLLKRGYARVWPTNAVDYGSTPQSVWFTDADIAEKVSSIVYVANEQQVYEQFRYEMEQVIVTS